MIDNKYNFKFILKSIITNYYFKFKFKIIICNYNFIDLKKKQNYNYDHDFMTSIPKKYLSHGLQP